MADKLRARITHLEMTAVPDKRISMPMGPRLALMRAQEIPLAFYRFLYEQVGKPHHWEVRRDFPDEELSEAVHAKDCEIWVLYCEGAPAGFFELSFNRLPEEAEVVYFGLIPEFQGRGLGRFLLSEAIFRGFEQNPGKLTLHTNTLDSPKALHLYQRMGFTPIGWSEEEVEPWL